MGFADELLTAIGDNEGSLDTTLSMNEKMEPFVEVEH